MLKAPPRYGLAEINTFLTQPTSKFDASRCNSSWSVEEAETARLRVGTTPGPFPLNPSHGHCDTTVTRSLPLVAIGCQQTHPVIHEILGQPAAARSPTCVAKVKLGNTWSK